MKRCIISPIVREIQNTDAIFLPLILAKIQELFDTYLKLWRNWHSQTFQMIVQNGIIHWWHYPRKLSMHLFFLPAFSLAGIYPEDIPKKKFVQCSITGNSKILGTI